jgi:hypothetical protein
MKPFYVSHYRIVPVGNIKHEHLLLSVYCLPAKNGTAALEKTRKKHNIACQNEYISASARPPAGFDMEKVQYG